MENNNTLAKPFNKKKVFNILVDIGLIAFTVWGAVQNGLFTLPTLVSFFGVIGVIGLAHATQSNFLFNGFNNAFNMILSWQNRLFAEVLMNVFYFVSQFLGWNQFKEHRDEEGNLIVDKKSNWRVIALAVGLGFFVMGGFSWVLGGQLIILDSIQNSLAITAQYRQMNRKRDGWILWLIANLINIVVWSIAGVPQMAITFIVFSINSLRGYINWSE